MCAHGAATTLEMYLQMKSLRLSETVIPLEYKRKGELVHHGIKVLGLSAVKSDPSLLCISGNKTLEKGEDHNWSAILGETVDGSSNDNASKGEDIDRVINMQHEFSHLRNDIDSYYYKIKSCYDSRKSKTDELNRKYDECEVMRDNAVKIKKATSESIEKLRKWLDILKENFKYFSGDWHQVGPGGRYHVDWLQGKSGVFSLFKDDHTTEIGKAHFVEGCLQGRFITKYEGTDDVSLVIDYNMGHKEYVYSLNEQGMLIVCEHYSGGHKVERNEFYPETGTIKRLVWIKKKPSTENASTEQEVDMMEFDHVGRVIYHGPGKCCRKPYMGVEESNIKEYEYTRDIHGLEFKYFTVEKKHEYAYSQVVVTQDGKEKTVLDDDEKNYFELGNNIHYLKTRYDNLSESKLNTPKKEQKKKHKKNKDQTKPYSHNYYGPYGVLTMTERYKQKDEVEERVYYYPNFSNRLKIYGLHTSHLLEILYKDRVLMRKIVIVDDKGKETIIKDHKHNYHKALRKFEP